MITTNKCCFCATLRTGSIIIGVLQLLGSLLGIIGNIQNLTAESSVSTGTTTTFSISLILCVVQAVLSSLLLFGIQNQNHVHMFYYLWGETVYLIISVIVNFIIACFVLSTIPATFYSSLLIACVLPVYFLVVVYSYYKEMYPSLPN